MFMRKYTAILWASWREALYLPFSRDMMVCLVTPRASASSSCVIRDCFLNSCILVFTYTTLPFLLFPQAASQTDTPECFSGGSYKGNEPGSVSAGFCC